MRSQITKIIASKSGKIYRALLDAVSQDEPHKFIGDCYRRYLAEYPSSPSVNGRIFEYLICETLAQKGIAPFYYQAKFERVPNADFDLALYHATAPVVLTMKVSLRERYKQADLEGIALRQVYRGAKSYLITLEHQEARGVKRKIANGDITGLDACIIADSPEYAALLSKLAALSFEQAKPVMPITGLIYPSTNK